jgi:hypothetical protein
VATGRGRLVLVEVRDELLDRDDRDAVALAEFDAGLAAASSIRLRRRPRRSRPTGLQTREPHELDRGLGVAAALAHAAVDGAQRQDVAGRMTLVGVERGSASTLRCARGRRR